MTVWVTCCETRSSALRRPHRHVIGVPDGRLMEVPAAYVELVPGCSIDPEELTVWLEGRIASFKRPRHFRIVADWPQAATKIRKFRLRETLCAELSLPLDWQSQAPGRPIDDHSRRLSGLALAEGRSTGYLNYTKRSFE